MTNQELKNEVIKYYENEDYPFSYTIAGLLDERSGTSLEWKDLCGAYLLSDFTPADCKFMYGCNVVLVETCSKCETELQDVPGIGPYCPNKDCDVIDNNLGFPKPLWQLTGDKPYKERYNIPSHNAITKESVVKECIKEISQYHSTTIYDGFIPENPTREHYEEWAYIKGTNQGYNDAVSQIADGLKQHFGIK